MDLPLSSRTACLFIASALLLFVIARRASHYLAQRRFARDHGCKPPVALLPFKRNYPLGLGVLVEMLDEAKEFRLLDYWHRQYAQRGRTTSLVCLGKHSIFTVEPKNVQTILALKFKDYELGDRKSAFEPLLGHGIFSADGEIWERSRALLRPNFVRNQIADMEVYEVHVQNLIRAIPRDGSTVEIQELFFRMTLDSATEFLFGQSVGSLEPTSPATFATFAHQFNTAQNGLVNRIRVGKNLQWLYRSKEFSQAVDYTRNFVGQFVQKAIDHRKSLQNGHDKNEKEEKHYVFLNELSKYTLDKTTLTDQLLSILLAGRDTTASLLGLTFFVLARRPDVWAKLKVEVDDLNGRKPSFEQLKDMKYLTWVINETLRLYPIVPINARAAVRDTVLPVGGGPDGLSPVFVPKGSDVVYHTWTMHRLPEVYGPDAEEFRPERWESFRPGWAYLPFNGGPRICIGQQFALTEAGYTIVRLLQHFESVESRDPEPWREGLSVTLSSKNGTKVALKPIDKNL